MFSGDGVHRHDRARASQSLESASSYAAGATRYPTFPRHPQPCAFKPASAPTVGPARLQIGLPRFQRLAGRPLDSNVTGLRRHFWSRYGNQHQKFARLR